MRGTVTNAQMREYLEDQSVPEPNTGCWLWLGFLKPNGYGTLYYQGKMQNAHRFSYAAFNGPIPDKAVVMHRCDNPACINPEHLSVGSHSDNVQDMLRKGRQNTPSRAGSDNGAAILTDEQVREIRAIPRVYGALTKAVEKYGVNLQTLCGIRNRRFWPHVE